MTMANSFAQAVRSRPRLMISLAAILVAGLLLPSSIAPLTRALVAWNVGNLVFLIWSAFTFSRATPAHIAEVAEAQEAGEWTVFAITVFALVASVAAVVGEFSASKGAAPAARDLHIALVASTLLLSWLTTHTIFALRYAHEYYNRADSGADFDRGLEFPSEKTPDYWDFTYFAIVLGMTFQVSDVADLVAQAASARHRPRPAELSVQHHHHRADGQHRRQSDVALECLTSPRPS